MERTDTAELPPAPTDLPGLPKRSDALPRHTPGSSRELLALAAPLILSQSFMTVQIVVETVLKGVPERRCRAFGRCRPGGHGICPGCRLSYRKPGFGWPAVGKGSLSHESLV